MGSEPFRETVPQCKIELRTGIVTGYENDSCLPIATHFVNESDMNMVTNSVNAPPALYELVVFFLILIV